jgi:hypothetical protein
MAVHFKIVLALILLGAICIAGGTDMPDVMYQVSGSDQASSDDLSQYQEYYNFDQGGQSQTGPIQYMVSGSEPESLVVGGESRPFDPRSISINSLWIQGSSSWTQYIKCPLGATFRMLAFSYGGPVTMVEVYPDGRQLVNNYYFYPDYTRLIFEADTVGRHTLSFYAGGQKSNDVIVDVLPYGGSYYGGFYPWGYGYSGGPQSGKIVIHTGGIYGSDQEDYGWSSEGGNYGQDQQIVIRESYP